MTDNVNIELENNDPAIVSYRERVAAVEAKKTADEAAADKKASNAETTVDVLPA